MKEFAKYTDLRDVYTETLIEIADNDDKLVVLEADLMSATGTKAFKQKFPSRLINVGVAEANMVGIASGMSSQGFIPFANTFGCFATRRAYDQFFLSANYARQNVKLVGTDPGVTATYNGGTHMPFCDTALTRVIPDLVVVEPCDAVSLHHIIKLLYTHKGSSYMRLQRKGNPVVHQADQKFELGKGIILQDGVDVTLMATGVLMMQEALQAAAGLEKMGLSVAVIDMHTVKPLDTDLVLEYARKTGAIVTCENAQMVGGLGGGVAEFLSETYPTVVKRVGVRDLFGEVGPQDYLQERFELNAKRIMTDALAAIALKKS